MQSEKPEEGAPDALSFSRTLSVMPLVSEKFIKFALVRGAGFRCPLTKFH